MGVVAYLIWARYEKVWPFGPKEIREVFVEEKTTFTQSGQIHGRCRIFYSAPGLALWRSGWREATTGGTLEGVGTTSLIFSLSEVVCSLSGLISHPGDQGEGVLSTSTPMRPRRETRSCRR
jgi:hypothetical protein